MTDENNSKTPQTMNSEQRFDCAQKLIQTLDSLGVEYIFGYSGGAAIPIFDALETVKTNIKFILVRHEQGAAHMADGYARATGKPAVVLVTSGPGAGNILTGIMTAQMDSVPLIAISGQQVTWALGTDAFQEADIYGITMPVVKHSYLVKEGKDICRIAREAYHIATTGRPGPVLIDIPKDISQGMFEGDENAEYDLVGYNPENSFNIDKSAIEKAVELIKLSERPVILAGHGAMIAGADEELVKFAEIVGAPVTSTLLGKGVFRENHPLSLGMLGMHGTAYANKAIVEADLIINIGSRFDDRIIGQPDKFGKNAKKIHVDIDVSEINKTIKVDVGIIGDAKAALIELNKLTPKKDTAKWVAHIDGYKKKYPLTFKKQGGLRMQQILQVLNDMTQDKEIIISTDVGQHQMWAAQFCNFNASFKWLTSGGAGTMGYGFPAAVGAQFADITKPVVAVVGDGGFQMTLFELATAVIHKLPVKIIVMNNHYLGMVRQWQELFYDERESGVDLEGNPDFVKLAESYGAVGLHLRRPADIEKVLEKAFAITDRPVLINAECIKKENVFPMIPAGAALEDMLISQPKEQMAKPTGST